MQIQNSLNHKSIKTKYGLRHNPYRLRKEMQINLFDITKKRLRCILPLIPFLLVPLSFCITIAPCLRFSFSLANLNQAVCVSFSFVLFPVTPTLTQNEKFSLVTYLGKTPHFYNSVGLTLADFSIRGQNAKLPTSLPD